jgi:hypothetical protein
MTPLPDIQLELYRATAAAQDKFTYFLLAAAGAAIAFAATRTQELRLAWSQLPLGFAVVLWGLSFYLGCLRVQQAISVFYANFELLKIQSGEHNQVGRHPQLVEAASDGIREAIEKNLERAAVFWKLQFLFLIAGTAAYLAWHVLEMYLRRLPA